MTAQRVAALRRLAKVWGASGATATAEAPVAAALINEALDAVESFWREVERGRRVEAAARALLAAFDVLQSDPHMCGRCRALASWRVPLPNMGAWFACDEHAPKDSQPLLYAPAVRALCAALAEVAP